MQFLLSVRRGITLMELLLVIALIAIISAIGAPTVYHNFARESDQYMVDSVMTELEYARSMGLMDLPAYAMFETTADSSAFKCATQTKRLDGGVAFGESEFVLFGKRGQLIDSAGADLAAAKTLTVKAATRVVGTVVITPAGLIRRQ